ncbi:MAG: NUDIX domain-containing protein, partial [Pseudomonadota bacterium]
PSSKPKKKIPTRNTVMLAVLNQDSNLLMQRRPNHGIWGGLWSFPEFENSDSALNWVTRTFNQAPETPQHLPDFTHTFSHFKLVITPMTVRFHTPIHWVMEADDWVWYKHGTSQAGLAAPVNQLIKQLAL